MSHDPQEIERSPFRVSEVEEPKEVPCKYAVFHRYLDTFGILYTYSGCRCNYTGLAQATQACISRVCTHRRVSLGVYLTGVHLMGAHLVGLHLMGVHLTGMHLMETHLMGMHLIGVHLMA